MTESLRECSHCHELKPKSMFKWGKAKCVPCVNELSRVWKANNKERVASYNKEYKSSHRAEIREYERKIASENITYKIGKNLRCRIWYAIKDAAKATYTKDFLGCSWPFFLAWLKFNMAEDMSFENYGE